MTLGARVRTAFRVLLVLQVLTAFAGIGLLARMEPAIGRIMTDNDRSLQAVEQMLAVLAHPDPAAEQRARFAEALSIADHNITEPEEREVLARLRAASEPALTGNRGAVLIAIRELRALGHINREAMRVADRDALRLGLAGRWALTLLGLMGLLAGVISTRRVQRRFLTPINDLAGVIEDWRGGEGRRRCRSFADTELTPVLAAVNELLDRAERPALASTLLATDELRAALALFMDRAGGRVALVDADGELVAVSEEAMALMAVSGVEIRHALREGEPTGWIERIEPVRGTSLRAVSLRASNEKSAPSAE